MSSRQATTRGRGRGRGRGSGRGGRGSTKVTTSHVELVSNRVKPRPIVSVPSTISSGHVANTQDDQMDVDEDAQSYDIPVNGSEEEDVIQWEPSPPRTQVSRKRAAPASLSPEPLKFVVSKNVSNNQKQSNSTVQQRRGSKRLATAKSMEIVLGSEPNEDEEDVEISEVTEVSKFRQVLKTRTTLQNSDDEDVFWEKQNVSAKSTELKSPFTPRMVAETQAPSSEDGNVLTQPSSPNVSVHATGKMVDVSQRSMKTPLQAKEKTLVPPAPRASRSSSFRSVTTSVTPISDRLSKMEAIYAEYTPTPRSASSSGLPLTAKKALQEPKEYFDWDASNPANEPFVCPLLVSSYISLPRFKTNPTQEHLGGRLVMQKFGSAMEELGFSETDPVTKVMVERISLRRQGPFLFNPARVNVKDFFLEQGPISKIIKTSLTQDPPLFCLFGTVRSSNIVDAIPLRADGTGDQIHKFLSVVPLSLEWQRTFAFFATLYKADHFSIRIAMNGGLSISTRSSKRGNNFSNSQAKRPSSSSSSSFVFCPSSSPQKSNAHDYLLNLVKNGGIIYPDNEINVYDATDYFKDVEDPDETDDIPPLNLGVLDGCPLWLEEIPVGSFVAVNFLPGTYLTGSELRMTFNLISVTILLFPTA